MYLSICTYLSFWVMCFRDSTWFCIFFYWVFIVFLYWSMGIYWGGYTICYWVLWRLFYWYWPSNCLLVFCNKICREVCSTVCASTWVLICWFRVTCFLMFCSEWYISGIMSFGVISESVTVWRGLSVSTVFYLL